MMQRQKKYFEVEHFLSFEANEPHEFVGRVMATIGAMDERLLLDFGSEVPILFGILCAARGVADYVDAKNGSNDMVCSVDRPLLEVRQRCSGSHVKR